MSLERILVVDYLLWQGYLPSDLDYLPDEWVESLLKEAYRFARREVHELGFDFPLTRYNAIGFSRN
jgi:hypothetical protein